MLASHGATLAHFISKEHVLHYGDFVPRNKSTIWYLNYKFSPEDAHPAVGDKPIIISL